MKYVWKLICLSCRCIIACYECLLLLYIYIYPSQVQGGQKVGLHILHKQILRCNVVFGMDSSAEAFGVDFFGRFTNVIATNIPFSSFIEVLGCPDLGALLRQTSLI